MAAPAPATSAASPATASPAAAPSPSRLSTALRNTLTSSLLKLDEATTIDEHKWRQRAQRSVEVVLATTTTAVRRTSSNPSTTQRSMAPAAPVPVVHVPPAAAELLHKYENEWIRLHRENMDIAHNAAVVDVKVQHSLRVCEDQRASLDRFVAQLRQLPTLVEALEKTRTLLGDLTKRIEIIEAVYDDIERHEDMETHNRWAFAQMAETDTYISNKRREQKVHEFNFKRQQSELEKAALAEKQRQLEEEFERQVDEYRKENRPRTTSVVSTKSVQEAQEDLAKVGVDVPPEETRALDDFLDVDAPNTSECVMSDKDEPQLDASESAEPVVEVVRTEEMPA